MFVGYCEFCLLWHGVWSPHTSTRTKAGGRYPTGQNCRGRGLSGVIIAPSLQLSVMTAVGEVVTNSARYTFISRLKGGWGKTKQTNQGVKLRG